jgi:hypothetical protein
MKDVQLINLLKSLSEAEFEEFERFLDSPFYNSSETIKQLFVILKKFYPFFTSPDYDKKKVFAELFPEKAYNNLLINEYYHLLSNLVVEFIKQSVIKRNELNNNIELLNEYRMRGLKSNFNKLVKKIEEKLKNDKFDNTTLSAVSNFEAAKINARMTFDAHKINKQIEEISKEYQTYLTALINVTVSEYLSLNFNFQNVVHSYNLKSENLFNKLENDKIFYKLYEYVKEQNPYDYLFQINLDLADLLKNPQEKSKYYSSKKLIFENKEKYNKSELLHYLIFLTTYCINMAYSPLTRKEFSNEYVELEFFVLREKLFMNQKTNYLSNLSFRNLLIMIVNLKETEKINELIEYSIYLRPEHRLDFKNFAKSNYYCLTHSYSEAQKYVKKIIPEDKQLELDVNFLNLKILFEVKDYLKGIETINRVRRLVNYNSHLSLDRKKKYRVFLNYLEKLFKKFEKNDEAGITILFNEIIKHHNIVFAEWFEEKYKDFFNSKKNNNSMTA